jgi:putative acetyltransferase
LVRAGIQQCVVENYDAIVVLGHPHYYPRFGFQPARDFHIRSDFEVPDDAFMVLELETGILKGSAGTIHYHPLFEKL